MITGIKKTHKTTEIFFDEASDILIINTYNTSLKNRLTAYAKEHQVNYHGIDKKQCREIRAKKQAQGHTMSW